MKANIWRKVLQSNSQHQHAKQNQTKQYPWKLKSMMAAASCCGDALSVAGRGKLLGRIDGAKNTSIHQYWRKICWRLQRTSDQSRGLSFRRKCNHKHAAWATMKCLRLNIYQNDSSRSRHKLNSESVKRLKNVC